MAQVTRTPLPADQVTVTALDPLNFADTGAMFLSPNGNSIAWVLAKEICIYSAASEKQHCARLKVDIDETSVRWSPDSSHIAFTEDFFRLYLDSDIWIMDVATGETIDLTDDNTDTVKLNSVHQATGVDIMPNWTNDSKRLFFLRYGGAKNPPSLFSIHTQGGTPTEEGRLNAVSSNIYAIAISPDNKKIAYSVGTSRSDPLAGLWIADLDGTNPRQLLKSTGDNGSLGKVLIPVEIQFSPDGKYVLVFDPVPMLAYESPNASTDRVVSVDGSGDFPVDADDDAKFATWSPDGRSILYIVHNLQAPDRNGLYTVAKPGDKGRLVYQGLPISPPIWNRRPLFWTLNHTLLVQVIGPGSASKTQYRLMHLGIK